MRYFLLIGLFLIINLKSISQTLLKYDYIETYDWLGGWSVGYGNNAGFYTNASVTPTYSAALIGAGNGTSNIEEGVYVLPNVTGLNSLYEYELRFRLGSYKFGGPSAATAGLDVADYLLLYVSYDNATNLTQEIRINGYNNSLYNYNSTQLYKTANGTLSTYSLQNGQYSDIRLKFTNATQFTARIYVRVNSLGEEWWLDNFELWQITTPLPVELLYFDGSNENTFNSIEWMTNTEYNSSHFILEKSDDGILRQSIGVVNAAVNSTQQIHYSFSDYEIRPIINYYRLKQFDFDGKYKNYGPIDVDNRMVSVHIVKMINLLGQEVDHYYTGTVIIVYSDGSSKIVIR
jgi:hypothetical protein